MVLIDSMAFLSDRLGAPFSVSFGVSRTLFDTSENDGVSFEMNGRLINETFGRTPAQRKHQAQEPPVRALAPNLAQVG